LSVAFPVVTGLVVIALTFASPTAQAWIAGVVILAAGVTNTVTIGLVIARWRAKWAKVPDGPEADYVDPPSGAH